MANQYRINDPEGDIQGSSQIGSGFSSLATNGTAASAFRDAGDFTPWVPQQFGAGILDEYESPAAEFRRFAGRFAPGYMRNMFYGQQAPLTARYQLRYPTMQGTDPQTFTDFLTGFPERGEGDLLGRQQLFGRARDISDIIGLTPEEYLRRTEAQGLPGSAFTTPVEGEYGQRLGDRRWTPIEAAAARQMYQGGPDATQNLLGLVNLLALQRPEARAAPNFETERVRTRAGDRPQYTGVMAQAIGGLISDLYDRFIGADVEADPTKGPGGNFLKYYLDNIANR